MSASYEGHEVFLQAPVERLQYLGPEFVPLLWPLMEAAEVLLQPVLLVRFGKLVVLVVLVLLVGH